MDITELVVMVEEVRRISVQTLMSQLLQCNLVKKEEISEIILIGDNNDNNNNTAHKLSEELGKPVLHVADANIRAVSAARYAYSLEFPEN